MPTVSVDKAELFERLGRTYTNDEFDELCFEFGIELDEDTTAEVEANIKKGLPAERPQLKIEIAANRYDMLCIEGISRTLRTFLQLSPPPKYKLIAPPDGKLLTVTISPETARIRPYFAGAILRNVKFTPQSYASFIDLQDKLHQNICRRRTLVAIGTHDLDTLLPPFRYEARPPKDIKFAPLNKEQVYDASQLMTLYESDRQLSKYLHIIRDSPVYPIIYDQKDRVLSMPPIINSNHSKINLNTRNVFIDCTATDETKLAIVVNMVATMFSEYCEDKFSIEPIKVVSADGSERITPDISTRRMATHVSYVNACAGFALPATEIKTLLNRMSLSASTTSDPGEIVVDIPATRPDVLHPCDLVEDAATAYGYNNLPRTFPPTSTVSQPLAVSKLSDLLRQECALAGWVEVLPLILCSHDENFAWMSRKDDGTTAVKLANPKALEYQVVRTSLLPGLLKTIRENRAHALPMRIFETSDVVVKDSTQERQARNIRKLGAVWCNKTAGFEVVHGLLDRVMAMLEIPRLPAGDVKSEHGYYIKEVDDPSFFPGRAASIFYRPRAGYTPRPSTASKVISAIASLIPTSTNAYRPGDVDVGVLGILHPTVLGNFEIQYPCSALELNIDWFKKEIVGVWEDDPIEIGLPGSKV